MNKIISPPASAEAKRSIGRFLKIEKAPLILFSEVLVQTVLNHLGLVRFHLCCAVALGSHLAADDFMNASLRLFLLNCALSLFLLLNSHKYVLQGLSLPDFVVPLLDQKLFVVGIAIEMLDDSHGVGGKDHLVTLTVHEKTWHLAVMGDLCDVDLKWTELVGLEMLLQDVDAEIDEQLR